MHQYPDQENTVALLGDWHKNRMAVDALMDGIEACIGLDINGPMFDTVWRLFNAYTDTLSVELGDFCGWLNWYCLENDMGARAMSAGYDKKTSKIKTLVDLAGLIEQSRKRKVA